MPGFQRPPFDLDDMARAAWDDFEHLGVDTVRRQLAAGIYGDRKIHLARAWIERQESLKADADRAAALTEARAANEVATKAADSARVSATAAWANVWVSIGALVVSLLALTISVISLLNTK